MSKRKYTEEEQKLIQAIIGNDAATIADLCEANSNLMPAMKDVAFFFAVANKNIEENTIGTLAEFGANFLAQRPERKTTCLHIAAAENPEYIKPILRIYNSVLTEVQDLDQKTAERKMAEFIDMREMNGYSVVHYVPGLYDKAVEVRKLLLENGGNINAQGKDGKTVAHLCIELLTESGKKDKRDPKQMEFDRFIAIERFVKEGLDPTIKDKKGKTVLDSIGKEYKTRIKALQEGNIPDLSQLSMAEKMEARKVSSKSNIRQ